MNCSCRRCYECSGVASKGGACFCGCDRCRRCCTKNILKCNSGSFITYVFNQPNCISSLGGFSSYKKADKNYYDIFFKKIRSYVFFQKKKMNWYKSPFKDEKFDFLKSKKRKKIINFDFDFTNKDKPNFKFKKNKPIWFYKKQIDFYDHFVFNNKNKINYLAWSGNSWIEYRKNCNFKLLDQKDKKPFYVVFDNNFNLIDTDCLEIREKGLNYIINGNTNKNILIVNSEINFQKQDYYEDVSKSLVNCEPESICYSFITTVYATDTDGCGICCPFTDIGNILAYSVGGVCIGRTDYSDKYVYYEGKKIAFIRDGFGFSAILQLTPCGLQQGLAVQTFPLANYAKTCPCSFASYCNPNKKKCYYGYGSLGNRLKVDIPKLRKEYHDYIKDNFKRSIR